MDRIAVRPWQSPAGDLLLGSYKGKLCLCDWAANDLQDATYRRICRTLNAEFEEGESETIEAAIAELEEYFACKRQAFTIPLLFTGTGFQCRVWRELLNIPYGHTISYAEEARRIGNPKAVRAVASANASNPISIFVPCHRVIGSNRTLVGYGGGLHAKQFLLDLEASRFSLFGR